MLDKISHRIIVLIFAIIIARCYSLEKSVDDVERTAADLRTSRPKVEPKLKVIPPPTPETLSAESFNAANSAEFDSEEQFFVYPLKKTEKFIPPACGRKIPTCNKRAAYRTFDGSCNNLENPNWGVPNSTYSRLLPSVYSDLVRRPRTAVDGSSLPSAREVRVDLFPMGETDNDEWNVNALIWGQFIAHDMSLLKQPENNFPCCTPEGKYCKKRGLFCFPVKISPKDPTMGASGINCMNFTRTMTDKDFGCVKNEKDPAEQINAVTAYMDLSNVYGLDREMSNDLRSFKGGKFKVEIRNNHIFPPKEMNKADNCRCSLNGENVCYKSGDSRTNQNPHLAVLQIIFVREHNRIATELARVNPTWNDEKLFQEARRILIAIYQRISYYEWLPIFLGSKNVIQTGITFNETGFINDYDVKLNPAVTSEHAHAAYRFFHTHIVGLNNLINAQRQKTDSFLLSDWFNRPEIIEKGNNLELLTMGMLMQNMSETDNLYVKDITDKLFACGKKFGIDLRAADIQRDRDHSIAYYNDYREYCKFPRAKTFEDFGDFIPKDSIVKLKLLYNSPEDVDLSVGGALEELADPSDDIQVGPTFLCILNEQFKRTRQADRFWFENKSAGFTLPQLAQIRNATVSRMFCDSGDGIEDIQPIGFTLLVGKNQINNCTQIPKMDFSPWKARKFQKLGLHSEPLFLENEFSTN